MFALEKAKRRKRAYCHKTVAMYNNTYYLVQTSIKIKMGLFKWGKFKSHSGLNLKWKIECDSLDDEDYECLKNIILSDPRFRIFNKVIGIPMGGNRLANFLKPFEKPRTKKILVVDDVLTSGRSMRKAIRETEKLYPKEKGYLIIGLVIFSRPITPNADHNIYHLFKT